MRKIIYLCSFIIVLSALVVIVGWIFNIDIFKRIVPGFVTMKFSTALSFLFSGVILFMALKISIRQNNFFDILLPVTVLAMMLFMGTSLLSTLLNIKSGIEGFFIQENTGAILTTVPGRPSIGTMIAFTLFSLFGLNILSDWKIKRSINALTGITIIFIGLIALLGYLFSKPMLYYFIAGYSTAMAIHTAILFIVLGIGVFLFTKIQKN